MRILTDYQKNFLLDYFFKNEKYGGWKSIATKLLETGQCIVGSKECIWIGGIGNFIKTEEAKDTVDCTLYKFDLEYFFSSLWYKEIRSIHASNLSSKRTVIEQERIKIEQELIEIDSIS